MKSLTKTTIVLLFLFIWLVVFNLAIVAKRQYEARVLPLPRSIQPFAFAELTDEELRLMEEERATMGDIRLPLTKKIRIFSCPKKTCKILGWLPAGSELNIQLEMMQNDSDWLPIPWQNEQDVLEIIGYIWGADLENSYQAPPPIPQTSFNPDDMEETDAPPTDPIPINPQSIVGIVCQFDSESKHESERRMTRGSGAIITNDGYIITARSVVDLTYLQDGFDGYTLTNCLVGQLPPSAPLPSTDAIRKINAFVRIPYLAYTADVAYISPDGDLSDYEKAWLDFAILQINGVNPDVKYFGGPTRIPDEFPIAPFLISELPKINNETLNFAFPSGTSVGQYADIRTIFMQGLISHVTGFWAGDARYATDLFLIENYLDTEDTAGGRFGSPVFWKGYIVGVHTAKQQGSRQIYNLGAKAVLSNMADNQFIIPLSVQ